jgi:hypothetical protein
MQLMGMKFVVLLLFIIITCINVQLVNMQSKKSTFVIHSITSVLKLDENNICRVNVVEEIDLTFSGSFSRIGRYISDTLVSTKNVKLQDVTVSSNDLQSVTHEVKRSKKDTGVFIVVKFKVTPSDKDTRVHITLNYSVNSLFVSNLLELKNKLTFGYKFNAPIEKVNTTILLPTFDPILKEEEIEVLYDTRISDIVKSDSRIEIIAKNIDSYDKYEPYFEIRLRHKECSPQLLDAIPKILPGLLIGLAIILFLFRQQIVPSVFGSGKKKAYLEDDYSSSGSESDSDSD